MKKVVFFLSILIFFSSLLFGEDYSKYAYDSLSIGEQALYKRIAAAVTSCEGEVDGAFSSAKKNTSVLSAFLDDNPDVFWVDEDTLTAMKNSEYILLLTYSHQNNFSFDARRLVNLSSRLDGLTEGEDDYGKAEKIYGYLSANTEYDSSFEDSSLWPVLESGKGNSLSLARAMQYLLRRNGIPAVIVHGYRKDENGDITLEEHSWVMALIDGVWGHICPSCGRKDGNGNVDYSFFMRSDEKIENTHKIHSRYSLPSSESDDSSYTVKHNRYMTTYDFSKMISIIKDVLSSGEKSFAVEFGSYKEMSRAVMDLITFGGLKKIASSFGYSVSGLIYYYTKADTTLRISFKNVE